MVYLALLATTLAFTLAGVIIFNLAETDFVDTVDNGVKYANQLTSGNIHSKDLVELENQ